MTGADVVLMGWIVVFLGAWWMRRMPSRGRVLWLSATAALATGLWSVWDDRWQAGVGCVVSLAFLLTLLMGALRGAGRGWVANLWGVFLTLLGVLAVAAIYMFPVWRLPAPSGDHAVGLRSFELDDSSRLGVFHAESDVPRRLLVRVWYPAEPNQTSPRRKYFNALEAQTTARSLGEQFGFPPFLTYLKHVPTNAHEDAPLLAGATGLPVIFYSHGYGSFLAQNSVLMEELASHGYVVYCVQHTYDSCATAFPDGSVAGVDPAFVQALQNAPEAQGTLPKALVQGYAGETLDERLNGQLRYANDSLERHDRLRTLSAPTWLADRLFVHDRLQSGDVPESVSQIVAASDLTRTGEMGMSFGGSTSGAVCMLDKRCVAGVNLDGGDFHYLSLNADVPVPFLMLHSDFGDIYKIAGVSPKGTKRSFNDFSYESLERSGMRDDIYRMEVKRAAHLGLSDLTLFMRRPLRNPVLGSTPADVMIGAQNDLVRGFFDKHLRGATNDFPAAQYRKYKDWVVPYENPGVREWWLAKTEEERATLSSRIEALKTKMNLQTLRRE